MRRRLLGTIALGAAVVALGAVAYGWLAQRPLGPVVGYGEFVRHIQAGEVARVEQVDAMFVVVDSDGATYLVSAPPTPGLNVSWLSMIQQVAASVGRTFDAANYVVEPTLDLTWVGVVLLASVLTILVAGYIYFMTGPGPGEPSAGPRDIQ